MVGFVAVHLQEGDSRFEFRKKVKYFFTPLRDLLPITAVLKPVKALQALKSGRKTPFAESTKSDIHPPE